MSSHDEVREVGFSVEGMTCGSCVRSITDGLLALSCVYHVVVSLEHQQVTVWAGTAVASAILCRTVQDMGFNTSALTEGQRLFQGVRLGVQGMTCGSCVRSITDRLTAVPGVVAVSVSLAEAEATCVMDPVACTPAQLCTLVDDMGFEATYPHLITFELPIHGMTCMSCVRSITDRVKALPGVRAFDVSLEAARGAGSLDPQQTSVAMVHGTIEDMGFEVGEAVNTAVAVTNSATKCALPLRSSTPVLPELMAAAAAPRGSASAGLQTRAVTLAVSGMTCASCVALIEGRMQKQPGVRKILVALLAGQADITYDPRETDPGVLVQAIQDIGFGAEVVHTALTEPGTVQVSIGGMTCASCVAAIETRVLQLRGVQSAKVALSTSTGTFAFDPAQIGARQIIQYVFAVAPLLSNPPIPLPKE